VRSRRVNFHTRSMAFSSGLLGGRKSSRRCLRFFFSHGCRSLARCHRALSRTTTILRPLRRRRTSCCKKERNVSALNFSARQVVKRPSAVQTAPNTPTFFRVGACKTTGSTSSGGTHIVQREPCCWKWHSSSNHRSTSSLLARRLSFFIISLRMRIGFGNEGARLAPAESQLVEHALALTYLELHPVDLS